MNTHDQFIYEQVAHMRRRFPHVVTILWTGVVQAEQITKWCEQHVGERGTWWEWIVNDQYAFKQQSHAAEFSLIWSGT